jgi:CspA family cold shock protein
MDFHGTIEHWNEHRGFGFVKLDDGRKVFCHLSALRRAGIDKLRIGERVEVDIEAAPDGRTRVAQIAVVETPAAAGRQTADAVWLHPGRD